MMSRGFVCALLGVGFTLLAWFGPWLWPAWPAFFVLELAFTPDRPFSALPVAWRGILVVMLIAFNIATWGVLCRLTGLLVESSLRSMRRGQHALHGSVHPD